MCLVISFCFLLYLDINNVGGTWALDKEVRFREDSHRAFLWVFSNDIAADEVSISKPLPSKEFVV